MDYEKKYKEALERAKESLKDGGISSNTIDYLENIFPELKVLEDERIRKELIKYLKEGVEGYIPAGDRSDYQRWLAWVEKQSEQKWSEEDESKVKEIVYFLDTAKVHYASTTALDDCVEWLKSLKQRMEE